MDWNKSNIVLIIAFLLINIFLLFSILYNNGSEDATEKNFKLALEEMLTEKGISISSEIPKAYGKAPFLELEYGQIKLTEEMIKLYIEDFDGEFYENVYDYSSKSAKLSKIGNNKLVYEKLETDDVIKIMNVDENKKIISDFCRSHDIDMKGFMEESYFINEEYEIYEFKQMYEGFSIDNSYRKFFIKKHEIVRFEMQTVDDIIKKAEVDVVNPYEALIRVITEKDNFNKEIIDMKACYYNSKSDLDTTLDYFDSDLVWKVIFSDGSYFYLDEH